MNKLVVEHLKSIINFRDKLYLISSIENEGEIMKIWARWIITHRSLFPQTSLFLPSDNEFDPHLIVDLIDKGISAKHACFIQEWMISEVQYINSKITWFSADNEVGGLHSKSNSKSKSGPPVTIHEGGREITLTCDGIETSLPSIAYNRMYQRIIKEGNYMPLNYIWYTCMLYSILDGKGFQWAVPNQVMNILRYKIGCETELFASPINSTFKKYYSLFPYDKAFGSMGNFFTAPDQDFRSGAFQVNPPFIDCLFTLTTIRILKLLSIADSHGEILTFVYIMPHWDKFVTYDMAIESQYCVKHINLPAYNHSYYQHITNTYIKARFGTSIIFLSTNPRCCDNNTEFDIIAGFSRT